MNNELKDVLSIILIFFGFSMLRIAVHNITLYMIGNIGMLGAAMLYAVSKYMEMNIYER